MKNAKMKERMQSKLQQKQQQPPLQPQQKVANPTPTPTPANNIVRPTTAVYTASSGEQIQQTPRTAKPGANIVVGTNATTNTTASESTETGYEPVVETQKKKKNKNKK
jgi:hypothetical protein